jgi:hypothetical protein
MENTNTLLTYRTPLCIGNLLQRAFPLNFTGATTAAKIADRRQVDNRVFLSVSNYSASKNGVFLKFGDSTLDRVGIFIPYGVTQQFAWPTIPQVEVYVLPEVGETIISVSIIEGVQ